LMDEITVKPSPGPITIEYDLVDDLITKSAVYKAGKAAPSNEAIITQPVASPVIKAEPVKTISVHEIPEILKEKRNSKPAAGPSAPAGVRSTPSSVPVNEGIGSLSGQAEKSHQKAVFQRALARVLAALRIYNRNEFYIQDTDFPDVDTLVPEPPIKGLTFKVIYTPAELDKLIDDGCDLVIDFNQVRRGLGKGMVAFLILVDRELASMGWACMTEASKSILRGYPYYRDLDRLACIVGGWTNPRFQDSSISSYLKHKRHQLLKEMGFIFERSIVAESTAKDLCAIKEQNNFEFTYRLRTYTNVSLPGIFGVEFWNEHLLNETDSKPLYRMLTLLFLVFPLPPAVPALP